MNFLRDKAPVPADTLIVLLPGAYTTPRHFVEAGFINAVRQRDIAADVHIAALDLATISDSSYLAELRAETLLPARNSGYRSVWLGGISLGGYLALAYVEQYPEEIDGLCLLAPYPGNRMTTGEIAAAGGIHAWEATPEQLRDPEYRIWHWLKTANAKPPLFMGFGLQDRFAAALSLMSAGFGDDQVRRRPGDHDWPTWRTLWDEFLDSDHLPVAMERPPQENA